MYLFLCFESSLVSHDTQSLMMYESEGNANERMKA